MIDAHGYTAEVQCDFCVKRTGKEWATSREGFYGIDKVACKKDARQSGWKLNWENGEAKCPICVKEGTK